MRFRVMPHGLSPKLSLYRFDDADFVRRAFVTDLERAIALGCGKLADIGIIDFRLDAIADRECLPNDFSSARIHHSQELRIAAGNKGPAVLPVHGDGDGLSRRCDGPA